MNEQSQKAAPPRNLSSVALAAFPSGLLLFTEPLLALVLGPVVHQSSCLFLWHLPELGSVHLPAPTPPPSRIVLGTAASKRSQIRAQLSLLSLVSLKPAQTCPWRPSACHHDPWGGPKPHSKCHWGPFFLGSSAIESSPPTSRDSLEERLLMPAFSLGLYWVLSLSICVAGEDCVINETYTPSSRSR